MRLSLENNLQITERSSDFPRERYADLNLLENDPQILDFSRERSADPSTPLLSPENEPMVRLF